MPSFLRFLSRKPYSKTLSARDLASRIDARHDKILIACIERARRKRSGTKGEPTVAVKDHLPELINEMARVVCGDEPSSSAWIAEKHGFQRASVAHFGLEDLRDEHGILLEELLRGISEGETLSQTALLAFARMSDLSLSHSTEAFIRHSVSELREHRAEQLASADRLTVSQGETSDSLNQQSWFLEAINRIPKPLFFLDLKKRQISYSNSAAKEMFGFDYQHTDPLDVVGKEFQASDRFGNPLQMENLPSQRALRGERVHGEEIILQTPTGTCLTAIKRLRAEDFKTPVIAFTAHAMKEERTRCLEADFTDFISKPVSRVDLIEIIMRHRGQEFLAT